MGSAFYRAGLAATSGLFPAPLDDVYIHFCFARAWAEGSPFAWISGQGYSSGGTSLLYPLVLAPGWLLGFRGSSLGIFAALVAIVSLVDLGRSLQRLFAPRGLVLALLAPPLLLAVPLLDWSLFSGMETAFCGALVGRVLLLADAAERADARHRARAQLAFGLVAALLYAARPELVVLALLLSVSVIRSARSLATLPSLLRSAGPTVAVVGLVALSHWLFTGELQAAGAIRKLASENPYWSGSEVALEAVKNLAILSIQAFDVALGGSAARWALFGLAGLACVAPRTRGLALPLVLSAFAMLVLVSFNVTAPFQNFRYAAPSLLLLLMAAFAGLSLLSRGTKAGAIAVTAYVVISALPELPRQVEHFARASRNIAEQQVVVAQRLAQMVPPPRRIFVNDAGAIPYLSGLPAVDGLGLGGTGKLPFARASVHGVPAVIELIERMPPAQRPDVLAVYAGWWPGLVDGFGTRVDAVSIADNVICGDREKVIYRADWSSLADPDEAVGVDALDVADLVSERAHAYAMPTPHGGYAVQATLRDGLGRLRFDGGRIIATGQNERFRLAKGLVAGPASLVLRSDVAGAELEVDVVRDGVSLQHERVPIRPGAPGQWLETTVPCGSLAGDDELTVSVVSGVWRSFRYAVVRP